MRGSGGGCRYPSIYKELWVPITIITHVAAQHSIRGLSGLRMGLYDVSSSSRVPERYPLISATVSWERLMERTDTPPRLTLRSNSAVQRSSVSTRWTAAPHA